MDVEIGGMFYFAQEEERAHMLAIIGDFIIRWDTDGVALDFDRDPLISRNSANLRI